MKIRLSIVCAVLSILSAQAAEFDLGTHGTLSVNVPDNWRVSGNEATSSTK